MFSGHLEVCAIYSETTVTHCISDIPGGIYYLILFVLFTKLGWLFCGVPTRLVGIGVLQPLASVAITVPVWPEVSNSTSSKAPLRVLALAPLALAWGVWR